MDSFEWNKIIGAVLFALLISVGLGIFSGILFETEKPESPGYAVAIAAPETNAPAAPAPKPIAALLQDADAKKGEATAKICQTCHDLTKGGPNKVGPNLWDVVNRKIASHPGFDYSDAMKKHADEAGTWTFENLNAFLHDPRGVVPGTKMTFAGLKKDDERANVIAFLHTLSDNPAPLPPPPAEAASAGGEAPAAGAAAPAAGEAPAEAAPAAPAGEAPAASGAASEAAPAAQPSGGTVTAPAGAPTEETQPAAPQGAQPPEQGATGSGAEPSTGGSTTVTPQQAPAEAPATEPTQGAAETTGQSSSAAPQAPAQTPEAPAQTAQAAPAAPTAAPAAPAAAPAAASAGDPAKGATYAKRCTICHSLEDGGPNKVGPHLFGVVGRQIASISDYAYSDAMKKFGAAHDTWTPELLDTYLTAPQKEVPGTKMTFVGIPNETDRQNVIAYLESLHK
jgi:cytochrome c2